MDRGLIPRALSAVFEQVASRKDEKFRVVVSYVEIYCEVCYDLLSRPSDQSTGRLDRLVPHEDEDGKVILTGLTLNEVASESDALDLLFLGDTNRVVAETSMNESSTRSHCVFCISIESHRPGSDTVRRSALNLVDLAGSERMGRGIMESKLAVECRYECLPGSSGVFFH